MTGRPPGVVIAGGGVAGLETLLGLHAPAAHVGAVFVSSTVEAVDARARALSVTGHHAIEYEALVVAIGAEPMPVVPHALTWDDRSDAEVLGGLLRHRRGLRPPHRGGDPRGAGLAAARLRARAPGRARSPARGSRGRRDRRRPGPGTPSVLGPRAVDAVARELEGVGIAVKPAAHCEEERGPGRSVVLQPVDEYCRVRGADGVWAAGDATDFPSSPAGSPPSRPTSSRTASRRPPARRASPSRSRRPGPRTWSACPPGAFSAGG